MDDDDDDGSVSLSANKVTSVQVYRSLPGCGSFTDRIKCFPGSGDDCNSLVFVVSCCELDLCRERFAAYTGDHRGNRCNLIGLSCNGKTEK